MSDPKSTLDKIQREITENLRREEELKKNHMRLENENNNNSNKNSFSEMEIQYKTNGLSVATNGSGEHVNGSNQNSNGFYATTNGAPKINGTRKFVPHTASKGVMQKFIKSRGRFSMNPIKPTQEVNDFYADAVFEPAKMNPGTLVRKGFVPADKKIERELTDFQERENELRKLRRQSQPDLMAALEREQEEESEWANGFREYKSSKHTKSMANLYQNDDDVRSQDSSAPSSLKPARSLAELCDLSDEETGSRTQSLILQFESMKTREDYA